MATIIIIIIVLLYCLILQNNITILTFMNVYGAFILAETRMNQEYLSASFY